MRPLFLLFAAISTLLGLTIAIASAAGDESGWWGVPLGLLLTSWPWRIEFRRLKARRDETLAFDLARAKAVVDQHATSLAIRRGQTVRRDIYGVENLEAWVREKGHFVDAVLAPAIGKSEIFGFALIGAVDALIEEAIAARAALPVFAEAPEDPLEYEQYCADLLRADGWQARLTKAAGDQGADVIADRDGIRLVIQCKRYTRAVGNAAVQEVIGARAFERADYSAVVTNANFTPAARQLAESSGVLLLHHAELQDLAARLAKMPGTRCLAA